MPNQSHREIKFTQVLEQLNKWRHELVEQMRSPSTTESKREEILKLKVQLDQAIGCLQLCERYQILLSSKVIEIGRSQYSHASEYHLMDNRESAEREYWKEVEINGKPIELSPDFLIIEKSQTLPHPRFTQAVTSTDAKDSVTHAG